MIERLGGDWYDVFRLPGGRTAFTVGDVCGHGQPAAARMVQAKQAIRDAALKPNNPMPIAVLHHANKLIFLNNSDVEFTTAVYGVIDTTARKVTYAYAGHHPPILARPDGSVQIMPNHGFPLGVEVEMPDLVREHSFSYQSGMMLVLYTDGLIEFGHDAGDGEARLLSATRDAVHARSGKPAHFIVERVLRAEVARVDDVAVLTIVFA